MKVDEYKDVAEKLRDIDITELERKESPSLSLCVYASAILATGACLSLIILSTCVVGDIQAIQGINNLAIWVMVLSGIALTGFITASKMLRNSARLSERAEAISAIEGEDGFIWKLDFLLREAISTSPDVWRTELFSDALIASAQKKFIDSDIYLEIILAARSRLAFCAATRGAILKPSSMESNSDF